MLVFKTEAHTHSYLQELKAKGKSIGFVPTMGALHNGHISLITKSKDNNDFTVCSIFVNPTQFNNEKDFEKYPVTIEQDIEMLVTAGCDMLFLPSKSEIYPEGFDYNKTYNLGDVVNYYEGPKRPGHFKGVCLVVERLLQIIKCNNLYLGQKDYQQCLVINQLIKLNNWEYDIKLNTCPTLREANGLAMSSRNQRLTVDQRSEAAIIFQLMNYVKNNVNTKNTSEVITYCHQQLLQAGFVIDYFELAHAETLKPISNWDGNMPAVILVAVFLGDVRLIDNLVL
jgi:pantoate--beta-alanine ligase